MFCFCFFIASRRSFKIQISPVDGKQVYHLIVAPKNKDKGNQIIPNSKGVMGYW